MKNKPELRLIMGGKPKDDNFSIPDLDPVNLRLIEGGKSPAFGLFPDTEEPPGTLQEREKSKDDGDSGLDPAFLEKMRRFLRAIADLENKRPISENDRDDLADFAADLDSRRIIALTPCELETLAEKRIIYGTWFKVRVAIRNCLRDAGEKF